MEVTQELHDAAYDELRRRRAESRAASRRRLEGREHGVRATYQAGCRCEPCRNANREYERAYTARAGRPSTEGGRGLANYAACVTTPRECLAAWSDVPTRVRKARAEAVRELHDALWRQSGPFRAACKCELTEEQREFLGVWA